MTAREEMLQKIRAVGADPSGRNAEYARIPRDYRTVGSLDASARLELFLDRLKDYGAKTTACRPDQVAGAIAASLTARAACNMIVPAGFPSEWLPPGFHFVPDNNSTYEEIDQSGGVLTLCAAAMAFTGTIVLQDQLPGQGRRALSLIPDYHLCVVKESQLRETAPEMFAALDATKTVATTTISGPSATSDIEMTRIKGVHGPRTLEVIVVLTA